MQLMSCVELFGVLDKLIVLEILKGSWALNLEKISLKQGNTIWIRTGKKWLYLPVSVNFFLLVIGIDAAVT